MELICQIKELFMEETLSAQGEEVLHLSCCIPELSALEPAAMRRINRYCLHIRERFLHYCRTRLLRQAAASCAEARARSRPFTPWEIDLTVHTEKGEDLLKITPECHLSREQLPPGRSSLTEYWDLSTGFPTKRKA